MPSDDRTRRALEILAAERERYRTAVAAAHEQIGSFLADHRARSEGTAQTATRELGHFAAGRIDAERFGAMFASTAVLSPDSTTQVQRCAAILESLLAEGDALFTITVPAGGDLRGAVDAALAHAGRSFAAVLAFQVIKAGHPAKASQLEDGFAFSRWNRAERLLAPPLVVEVDGADLRADALTEFLDGRARIALVVRGASTPVPLVRLITPATLVCQTSDAEDLAAIGSYEGPAIAALVPETAARFVHDPRKGASLRERLNVQQMPSEPPRQAVGARSAAQQRDELAQLAQMVELAKAPPATLAAAAANGTPPDGAALDSLASWLLAQASQGVNGATPPGGTAR